MNVIKIAPSLLSANFTRVEAEIRKIEQSGADIVHLDVMDGVFVPNLTFGPKMVKDIRKITELPLDVHLMIVEPDEKVMPYIEAGADMLSFHIEAAKEPQKLIELIHSHGKKCGVAISPDTDVSVAESLSQCDYILLMSVYPGFSGQKFIDKSIGRLEELKRIVSTFDRKASIEIDGGINEQNIGAIIGAGAEIIVAGNTFFNAEQPSVFVNFAKNISR